MLCAIMFAFMQQLEGDTFSLQTLRHKLLTYLEIVKINLAIWQQSLNNLAGRRTAEDERGIRKDGEGKEVNIGEKQRQMGWREREGPKGGGVETEVSCLRRRLAEKERGKKSLSCVCVCVLCV